MTIEYELKIRMEDKIHFIYPDERNITAFLTGQLGECYVAEDESYDYYNNETHEFDFRKIENSCCTSEPVKKLNDNEFIIFLHERLNSDEIEIIKRRIKEFNEKFDNKIIELKEIKKTISIEEFNLFVKK